MGSSGKVFNPQKDAAPLCACVFSGCDQMLMETDATNSLPTETANGQSELLAGGPEYASRLFTATKKETAISSLTGERKKH